MARRCRAVAVGRFAWAGPLSAERGLHVVRPRVPGRATDGDATCRIAARTRIPCSRVRARTVGPMAARLWPRTGHLRLLAGFASGWPVARLGGWRGAEPAWRTGYVRLAGWHVDAHRLGSHEPGRGAHARRRACGRRGWQTAPVHARAAGSGCHCAGLRDSAAGSQLGGYWLRCVRLARVAPIPAGILDDWDRTAGGFRRKVGPHSIL